jgi:rod shape-determining protein MreD
MITIWVVIIGAAILFIRSTWFSGLSLFGAQPDLLLLVLTYHSYRIGVQRGQITGFLLGFVEDGLSVSPPGFHAVVRLLHSAAIGSTRRSISVDAIVTPVTLTAIAFGVKTLVTFIMAAILGLSRVSAGLFTLGTILEGIMTIVLSPVVFWALRKLLDRFVRGLR